MTSAIERIELAKVGDLVWHLNTDYRGRGEEWRLEEITGETRVSFLTGKDDWNRTKYERNGRARPHRGYSVQSRIFGEADKDEYIWEKQHRRKILRLVEYKANANQLKQIAAIIGYPETE
jgi:hypothetical protein